MGKQIYKLKYRAKRKGGTGRKVNNGNWKLYSLVLLSQVLKSFDSAPVYPHGRLKSCWSQGSVGLLTCFCHGGLRVRNWVVVSKTPALFFLIASSFSLYPSGSSVYKRLGRERENLFYHCLHSSWYSPKHFWISFHLVFLEAETLFLIWGPCSTGLTQCPWWKWNILLLVSITVYIFWLTLSKSGLFMKGFEGKTG